MASSSPEPATPPTSWWRELVATWRGLRPWPRRGLRALATLAVIAWATQLAEMPWRSALRGSDNSFYYFWLRSLMVDGDWEFTNDVRECDTLPSEEFRQEMLALPRTLTGRQPNKYGIGWAVAAAPAYLAADATVAAGRALGVWRLERDGYNPVYQLAQHVWHFALALGSLLLAWRCARRWCDPQPALFGVLLLWGASPLAYYQTIKLTLSHSLSFLAVALMTWALLRARETRGAAWPWLLAGAAYGLAVITRFQLAVLAVVPAGLWLVEAWRGGLRAAARPAGALVLGALPLLALQFFAWHAVYGRWLVFTYGEAGEGFNWLRPELFGGLLSARHGLLYWHPFLLAGFVGLGWLAWRRDALARAGVLTAALVIYVNAAWWCWWFASSFGQRAFDAPLLFLMIGLAALLARLPAGARRAVGWLGAAATAWNFYVMALFYTTAIPRDTPVTWAEMLRAGGRAWAVVARFFETAGW
jgi:hypothetical protein